MIRMLIARCGNSYSHSTDSIFFEDWFKNYLLKEIPFVIMCRNTNLLIQRFMIILILQTFKLKHYMPPITCGEESSL